MTTPEIVTITPDLLRANRVRDEIAHYRADVAAFMLDFGIPGQLAEFQVEMIRKISAVMHMPAHRLSAGPRLRERSLRCGILFAEDFTRMRLNALRIRGSRGWRRHVRREKARARR